MDRAEAVAVVLSRGWLAAEDPGFQAALLAPAELQWFAKGDYVFRYGDPPGGFYGIAAGSFGTYLCTEHTGPHLSHLLHPGWWFGEGPALRGTDRMASIRAMETSHALHVPIEAMRDLIRTDPDAARRLSSIAQTYVKLSLTNVTDLMIRRADRRVGAVLLRVSGAKEDGALRRTGDICLTQTELAQMSNASRDLVNRTLAEFEAKGWVRLGYNRMAVLEPEALAAFAFGRR
ncbi:Crp/Fnr family transcriptional regulator [Paracraurococcus ruber]|nr:Crp/Fnr family transcriptional regulator [Paracraurococcus ruber]